MTHADQIETARRAFTAARMDHLEAVRDLGDYQELLSKVRALVNGDGSEKGAAYLAELDDVVAELKRQVEIYRIDREKKAEALDALLQPSPFQAVGIWEGQA